MAHERANTSVPDALLWYVAGIITHVTRGGSFVRSLAEFLLSGVCHQLPAHSLAFEGQPLPLCARCLGTFIGAVLVFAVLRLMGRGRASGFPTCRTNVVLGLLMAAWAVDGVNSLCEGIWGEPLLYPSSNMLRLATGLGVGIAWGTLLYPLYHQVVWAETSGERVLRGPADLAVLLASASALGALVYLWRSAPYALWAWACYLAVYLVLGTINALLAIMVFGREGSAIRWQSVVPFLAAGLAMALAETGTMATIRYLLTTSAA